MNTSVNIEHLFHSSLAQLSNEAKRQLIELLAASMHFPEKKPIKRSVKKKGIDEAIEDYKAGRVHKAKDVDDLMKQLES
jgi:hypothetical protein